MRPCKNFKLCLDLRFVDEMKKKKEMLFLLFVGLRKERKNK